MIITIYSTCQGIAIMYYLKKYYFPKYEFNIIHNYQIVLHKSDISAFRELLKNTSIFIYQEMPAKWDIYSTDLSVNDNILSYLNVDCEKIIIPYIYADWYWGINKIILRDGTADFDKIDKDTETKIKHINKEVILNLKQNYDLNTILKLYDNDKIDFKYEEIMLKGINILKAKEETCDIKLSDYILANYKKYKLFHMPNHPSHLIIKEMTKQILKKLNIDCSNFDNLVKNDNYNLGSDLVFSTYDKKFHNFEFEINCEDSEIKKIISEIYNTSNNLF